MILNCPECGTKYMVADAAIGAAGRMVRCANCRHSWFQAAPGSMPAVPPEQAVAAPLPEDSAKAKALRQQSGISETATVAVIIHKTPRWLRLACVALLVLSVILTPFAYRKSIITRRPELSFLFEPFGIYYTNGLALADVEVNRVLQNEKVTKLVIKCNIINEAKGSRSIPWLRVSLLGADGQEVLRAPNLADTGKNLITDEVQPCHSFEVKVDDTLPERARFDLSDSFDLALRRH